MTSRRPTRSPHRPSIVPDAETFFA
jgi:hypothetical protein